jgi:hypothetical protein
VDRWIVTHYRGGELQAGRHERTVEPSMSVAAEPRNPFYLLLLIVGMLFVVTALAYAIIPVLEQKATDKGVPPPPSELRDALRRDGGTWLLCELAVLMVLGIASMVLDRLRTLQKPPTGGTISPGERPDPPT